MPRPPKNPDHVLTRLRRALDLSREAFAKRVGMKLVSLEAIETGKYRLTPGVAARIAEAFRLNTQSVLRGDNPLMDVDGNAFNPNTLPADRRAKDRPEGLVNLLKVLVDVVEASGSENAERLHARVRDLVSTAAKDFGLERQLLDRLSEAMITRPGSYTLPTGLFKNQAALRRWINKAKRRAVPPSPITEDPDVQQAVREMEAKQTSEGRVEAEERARQLAELVQKANSTPEQKLTPIP
jgi:DNA-binding XRE family transcriptional regulator